MIAVAYAISEKMGRGDGHSFSGIVLQTGLGQQKDKNALLTEEQRRFPMSIRGNDMSSLCLGGGGATVGLDSRISFGRSTNLHTRAVS